MGRQVQRAKGSKGQGKGQQGCWVFVPSGGKGAPKPVVNVKPLAGKQQQQKVVRKVVGKGKSLSVVRTVVKPVMQGNFKGKGKGRTVVVQAKPKATSEDEQMREKLAAIGAEFKVWVGGLGPGFSWKTLDNFFKDNVAKPKLTHVYHKGTACVAMKKVDDVSTAISVLNGAEVEGKTLQVDVWTQKEKPAVGQKPPMKPMKTQVVKMVKPGFNKSVIKTSFLKKPLNAQPKQKGQKAALSPADEKMKEKINAVDNSLKVWVGGLSENATWQQLKKHFTEGSCKPNLASMLKKGAAVLTFDTSDEVANAVAIMNGSKLGGKGKDLQVDTWTRPERKQK